jgi:hypothetical protein
MKNERSLPPQASRGSPISVAGASRKTWAVDGQDVKRSDLTYDCTHEVTAREATLVSRVGLVGVKKRRYAAQVQKVCAAHRKQANLDR